MQYFIISALLVFACYLFFVFIASKRVVATGIVIAGNRNVTSKIEYNQMDKKPLYIMALCYAAKVKWLTLSEQNWVGDSFANVFNKTIQNWPEIPYVEMLSYLEKTPSVFQIKVYHAKKWSINNSLPKKLYSGDIATHYFFLLKAIVEKLNPDEKIILGGLFNNIENDIFDLKDHSYMSVIKINDKISELMSKV
jgi:hypothetical protein